MGIGSGIRSGDPHCDLELSGIDETRLRHAPYLDLRSWVATTCSAGLTDEVLGAFQQVARFAETGRYDGVLRLGGNYREIDTLADQRVLTDLVEVLGRIPKDLTRAAREGVAFERSVVDAIASALEAPVYSESTLAPASQWALTLLGEAAGAALCHDVRLLSDLRRAQSLLVDQHHPVRIQIDPALIRASLLDNFRRQSLQTVEIGRRASTVDT
jgi:hypothetical protein